MQGAVGAEGKSAGVGENSFSGKRCKYMHAYGGGASYIWCRSEVSWRRCK